MSMNVKPHQQGCWCPVAAGLSPGTSAASLWTPTEHRRSHLQKKQQQQTSSNTRYSSHMCTENSHQLRMRRKQTELTGENFTCGHFSHWQQSFNWRLRLQLGCPLEVNDGLSWSVHLLVKPEEELSLTCRLKKLFIKVKILKARVKLIYLSGQPGAEFYLESVAKFETQAGCHHGLVHLNVHL